MNSIGNEWVVSSKKTEIEVEPGNQDGIMEKERALRGAVEDLHIMVRQSQGPREVQRSKTVTFHQGALQN